MRLITGEWADALSSLQELTLDDADEEAEVPSACTAINEAVLKMLVLAGVGFPGLDCINPSPDPAILKVYPPGNPSPSRRFLTPSLEDAWVGPLNAHNSPPPDGKITLPRL